MIEGLGHGHQDLADPEAASGVLRTEGDRIIANASVVQYNEITADNIDSFHFHGDLSAFPPGPTFAIDGGISAPLVLSFGSLEPDTGRLGDFSDANDYSDTVHIRGTLLADDFLWNDGTSSSASLTTTS